MKKNKTVRLVVFDWAGTTVDYGSSAPADVFESVFKKAGIHLTREQINGPMGMEKKAHIRELLSLAEASEQWRRAYKRDWTDTDVENLYEMFENELFQVVGNYSHLLEGVKETVEWLRKEEIKVGSTTGYTAQMMERVIPAASAEGYKPDVVVTPDVTGAGRPTPFMLYECMRQMNIYPADQVVKVGDTIVDILEGKNASAWSIGVLTGSNLLGLTEDEYRNMDEAELKKRKEAAKEKYYAAGADLVIDCMNELPEAIATINEWLAKGEK